MLTDARCDASSVFSLHAKYEDDVRSGDPVSLSQLWSLHHGETDCWIQPSVDFADGTAHSLTPSKHPALFELSADKVHSNHIAIT